MDSDTFQDVTVADAKTSMGNPPAKRFELLHRIGIALSAERNRDRLLETILTEAQDLCGADGGTLYLRTDDDHLAFEILHNHSLNVALGGTSKRRPDFPALPLYLEDGVPNHNNVATAAAHAKKPVHVPNAYDAEGFDFSGTKAFDKRTGYHSKSFLTLPLINGEGRVIGVLQLLNATDAQTGEVVSFDPEHRETVAALASQAAIALDNKLLLEAQKALLESFIKMIAAAIDAKSPYTGGHCERVPILAEMIVQALQDSTAKPFEDFTLDADEWYELKIAAWLHDCGKVTTPVHVMDKGTKLETITDRIATVRCRFEILERDAKLRKLEALAASDDSSEREQLEHAYEAEIAALGEERAFVERANIGGEFLAPEARERVRQIGRRTYLENGEERPLLDDDEVENLCIAKGTLTEDERLIINGHMVQTIRMLEALPFPRNLRRVPEYAACHHEKMDGSGYPRGVFAGDTSLPARAMAVADVFEALTAADRPYKKGKKLSEAMRIMGFMKKDSHLDPEVFDEFVRSGVYRKYARKFLDETLIDEVDEEALLAIKPASYELPPEKERKQREEKLLDVYQERFPQRESTLPGAPILHAAGLSSGSRAPKAPATES